MKKLSKETIKELIKEYNKGFSSEKVGKKLNISQTSVLRYLKQNNIKRRCNTDYKKYSLDDNYFSKIDTENKAYFLGFIFADGNISRNKYLLVIDISIKDIEIIKKLVKELNYNIFPKLNFRKLNNNYYVKLTIYSPKLCSDLIKKGCVPNKTHIIKYPIINKKYNNHFIRGYFDGDGTVTSSNNKPYSINITSTYKLLDKLYSILEIECNIIRNTIVQDKNSFKLNIQSATDFVKFYKFTYSNSEFFLKRKYNLMKELVEICKNKRTFNKKPTSRHKGICFDKSRNKWKASYGKTQLGRFNSEEEAYERRTQYAKEIS